MRRLVRSLTIGISLSVAAAGCTDGGDERPALPALIELPEIQLDNVTLPEPGSDVSTSRSKAVGEVRIGSNRIVAYVDHDRCGILVLDSTSSATPIGLTSKWPKSSSEGTNKFPAGPYYSASGSGDTANKPWASLSCGENAMVIEYSANGKALTTTARGAISAEPAPGTPASLKIAVGSDAVRDAILKAPATS